MMNVDLYQAFPIFRRGYTVYLAILNFPQEDHFKEDNIILVGVLPGPTELKKQHQHFKTS